ncbi:hypothetical protein THAOC_13876, partial [Thalassiosira oceanica]
MDFEGFSGDGGNRDRIGRSMGSGGATTAATATADDYESESSTPAPFDWHQSDKDRWAEHFDALAAAEESKE